MITVSGSILINRPVADVFAYLAQFENDRAWRSEVTEVKRLEGPSSGLGERYVEAMHFPGFHVRAEFVVDAFDPPRLVSAEGSSEGMSASQRYELAEARPGVTRLDVTTRVEAHGMLAMGEPIAKRLLHGRAKENLRRLKRILERG